MSEDPTCNGFWQRQEARKRMKDWCDVLVFFVFSQKLGGAALDVLEFLKVFI